jgi:CubicO group peptidase (beta-lactamase class C family)
MLRGAASAALCVGAIQAPCRAQVGGAPDPVGAAPREQVAAAPQDSIATHSGGRSDDLAAILDGLIPGWLSEHHVPGVVVAVVRRDTVLLARGWGEAEAGSGRRAEPDTPFRVASVSKLVTATAALRLVEEGALALDADIAGVLGGDGPPRAFPGDVTLHHLLTHTAGFDLSDVGDATPDPERVLSPRELVQRRPQPQVLPPGLAHHYSNFGYALVGLLVEEASGVPFAAYVDSAVLEPLGMRRSSFAQPPPAEIRRDLAVGHAWDGPAFRALPLDFSHVGPADALVTTAADMASFLRFHLGGRPAVLRSSTLDTMHGTRYAASPSPYGMAYGFEENVLAGRRVLQHAGVQLGFASMVVLVPDDDLGVFVAQNAREGLLRWEILDVVVDRLLDAREGPPAPEPGRADPRLDAARYAGRYRHTGYTHATFEKAASVLGFRGSVSNVAAGPEPGTLLINGEVWRHAPALGAHMFAHGDRGWWVMGFRVAEGGQATHHLAGREVLERVRWWQRKRTVQLTLLATALLALLTALFWTRRRLAAGASPARATRRAVRAYALLWLVALGTFFATVPVVMNRDIQWDYGPTWELWLMLTLLTLAGVGAAMPVVGAVLAWRGRWWSLPARLGVTLFAVAASAAAAALAYMNLIGYRF